MNLKRVFALMLLMLMVFSTNVMFAQQMPPIPVDEAVRIGKLDCGLTYYIRHNNYPEHRVNFYIAQRVGSIQEEESQRGLAHFLEHMAFNGSEHFNGEGKTIIDYTRSLGVEFGRDMNAYTSIAETVYNINNVPSTRQSALDSCLLILKDWSGGLLLTDEEIDKERGVIHEEWRLSRGAQMRMLENNLETLYPNSKYGKRMPIGLMSVVDNFAYNELRDYYHKWYRPDNQALVIVGDVDVDHIEAQIKELFKDCKLDPNAAQVVEEPVPDNETAIIVVDKDKEQQVNSAQVIFKHDAVDKEAKTSLGYLLVNYMRGMMGSMLNSRLSEKAQDADCPYLMGYAYDGNYLLSKNKDAFNLVFVPKEGMTEEATQDIVSEAMRVVKHGFTETEYIRAREEYLSGLESQYNERNKVDNDLYGREYCSHYLDNEPIPSIEQKYEIMNQIVPMIPVEAINSILPEIITTDGKNLIVVNFNQDKEGAVYPTPEAMKAAVDAGLNANVEAYVDNVKQEPLIAQLPKKGKIVKETENKQFGYKELQLSNGARVILKKTDLKDDDIQMTALQRGGTSIYGEKDHANFSLFEAVVEVSGLGEFNNTELEKALAGKQVSCSMSMNSEYNEVSGSSTVKDLETLFQLNYLLFTDIRKDEKKFNNLVSQLDMMLKNRDLVPETAFSDSLSLTLGSHNWRSRPFTAELVKQLDYDRTLQMAKEATANAGSYTFYFVGSFDEAVIRPLIEQYIASLPGKKGAKTNWVNIDNYPVGQVINHFTRKMEDPKAYTTIYWYDKTTPYSMENNVKADLLARVLDKIYLQKIREDAGAAYSTSASGWSTLNGDNPFSCIYAYCPVKPEYTDLALQIMNDELVAAGKSIDASSLEDFKELLIKDYNNEIKENWYWMWVLNRYVERGLDSHTGYIDIVKAQTPETIAAFARQILAAGNKVEVVMTPAE